MIVQLSRAGAVLALALPAAAAPAPLASPVPVSPADRATVRDGHPLFRWRLPEGMRAEAIYVMRSPRRTRAGAPSGGVVERGALAARDLAWRPRRPLRAGRYWWVVAALDAQTSARSFSRMSTFLVPVELHVLSIVTEQSRRRVVVRWRGNVERALLTLRVIEAGRVVWTSSQTGRSATYGAVVSTLFSVPERVAAMLGRATFRVAITARS
jgi:hypothetical protein